jgi:tetratricopeptide (TPR) repeat protein
VSAWFQRTVWRWIAIASLLAGIRGFAQVDAETLELVAGFTQKLPPTETNTSNVNTALAESREKLASTNLISPRANHATEAGPDARRLLQQQLEIARQQRLARLFNEATPVFVGIILTNAPETMKRTALLELAIIAQEENDLVRAQQIFAHYHAKWSDDPNVPEVMLRQGLIFRQMGLHSMALTKFYAVMTSSLVLQSDKIERYQSLVLQAQTEIADTYYQQGKFAESVDLFARLLKNTSPLLNRPHVHFKLIRSLSALGRHEDAVTQAFDFLNRHAECAEQPEVRFYLATSLKRLGRNNESMQQVMLLLRSERDKATASPTGWAYWQQKTGNEIANQLYKEGDYLRALQLYTGLAALSTNADWQLPVLYQVGLTFERLEQPVKALEQYSVILQREPEVSTNASPSVRAIMDMARWRKEYLAWHTNVDVAAQAVRLAVNTNLLQTLQP